jgi:PAS domain S-box-containing protein
MSNQARILYVGDDEQVAAELEDVLADGWRGTGVRSIVESRPEDAFERLGDGVGVGVDCVVSEYRLADGNGLDFLRDVRKDRPDLPFVFAPVDGSEAVASEAVAHDVTFYVPLNAENPDVDRLADRVERAIAQSCDDSRVSSGTDRYRTVVEQSPVGIGVLQDGTFRYANPALGAIFGVGRTTVIGTSVDELFSGTEQDRIDEYFQHRATTVGGTPGDADSGATTAIDDTDETGETARTHTTDRRVEAEDRDPMTAIRSDGERIRVEVHARRIDRGGDPATIAVFRDVTDEAKRERELRRYEAFVESVRDSITVIGEDGTVEYLSPGTTAVVGHDPAELIGENGFEYVHPDDRSALGTLLATVVDRSGEPVTAQYRFRQPDGTWAWIESTAVDRLDDPAIDGVLLTSRNVTDRQARERELEQYETVVDNVRDAVWMIDEHWRVEFVNGYVEELVDLSAEEIVGRRVPELPRELEIVSDCQLQELTRSVDDVLASDAAEVPRDSFRQRLEIGDRVLDVKMVPTVTEDEKGIVGIGRDVTERENLESRLRQYERAIEGSMDLFAAVDDDYRYLFANDAYREYHGIGADSIAGRRLDEVLGEDVLDSIASRVTRTLTGEIVEYEMTRTHPDESDRHLDIRYYPLEDDDGDTYGIVAAMRDVTERIERQRALEALHDAASDLETAENESDVYEIIVAAAEDILDFDIVAVDSVEGDALVQRAWTLDERGDYYEETPLDEDTFATRSFHRQETIVVDDLRDYDITPADPDYRSALTVPIPDVGTFQAVSRDVGAFDDADRDLAELLVGHAHEALRRLGHERSLRRQRERLRRENERLDAFASMVSHDLRNPLAVAEAELQTAREACDDDALCSHLAEIDRAHDRLNGIVEDVLTMARMGQVVDDEEVAPVRLDDVARRAWANVSTDSATLAVETTTSIVGDQDRLLQVFENLYRNALEHGVGTDHERRGTDAAVADLTVHVGDLEDGSGFFVADDGVGIPGGDRETVFEAGYTTADDGTGFGLNIVEDVVEAHGWAVRVTESEWGGARFEILDVDTA